MPKNKLPESRSEALLSQGDDLHTGAGLADGGMPFDHRSTDQLRFAESMELQRCFSAIETETARQKLLALARRLASGATG